MMKFREALGEILRQIRKDQDKTLEFIAGEAKISIGYLSEIERGKKEASSELIFAICAALQVPLWMVVHKVSARLYSSREQISLAQSYRITSRSDKMSENRYRLYPEQRSALENKFYLCAA